MSEREPIDGAANSHRVALGIGAAGLAGTSLTAAILWLNHRRNAQNPEGAGQAQIEATLFDEERLSKPMREILGDVAIAIAEATLTGDGVIMKEPLVTNVGHKAYKVKNALGYLMPVDTSALAESRAYINRRRGAVDKREGYYALNRLFELIQSGASETLNQALDRRSKKEDTSSGSS